MFCVYDKDGKKVYESEKEEEANAYAIDNHDALMGKGELAEIIAKRNSKGEIELTIAGETRTCRPGDTWDIPTGTLHAAKLKAGARLMDVFEEPDRYPLKG